MKKFCGKCGTKLDETTGLCPNCDKEKLESFREWLAAQGQDSPKKPNKKKHIFLFLIVALLALLIAALAILFFSKKDSALPLLSDLLTFKKGEYDPRVTLQGFRADHYEILFSEEETVLFTVSVNEKVSDHVIALENTNGQTLGYMNDSGKDGDVQADDGIYSCAVNLSSDAPGSISYRASYYKATSNTYSIVFFTEITDDEYYEFQDIFSTVSACPSAQAAEVFLQANSRIEEYVVSDNSATFRTAFGMTGIYEWNCDPSMKGTGQYALANSQGIDYTQARINLANLEYQPAFHVSGKKIGVLRPFRSTQFLYDDFRYAGDTLSDFTGGTSECIDDGNVTLQTMKSLEEYKIVLIDSHGTMSNLTNAAWDIFDTDPYILTGEEYSAFHMWTSADWQAGRIVVCGTNVFSGKGYVAVGAKFFDRYYNENDLENSLFFLGTCYSLKNGTIADVLMQKGAKVVLGYSEPVSTSYCNATLFETLINSMLLSGASANEAFVETQNVCGASDPRHPDCDYVMRGNDTYQIISQSTPTTSDERDIVLVLDSSGSMSGTPMDETKKASTKFVETILKEDASIGIVTYASSVDRVWDFSVDEGALKNAISQIYDGGGTNMGIGLQEAQAMLESSNAKKKIIVLMSDGEPNEGMSDSNLIEYANQLKDSGITIYTLGFFEYLGNSKAYAQSLLEQIASSGCHYEVASADDLVFFFGDMADQINGQQYIYIRIACPVDVKVTYQGQTLSSSEKDRNLRTDFGTLSFEKSEGSGSGDDDQVKVLRLKDGTQYDIRISGTGRGTMDYTIGFMDENGDYSDIREFKAVKITSRTKIDTVADASSGTVLNVDEDGDGRYDLRYRADANGLGQKIRYDIYIYIIAGCAGCVILLILILVLRAKLRKRRKAASVVYCGNCGTALDDNITVCWKCGSPVQQDKQRIARRRLRKWLRRILLVLILALAAYLAVFALYAYTGANGLLRRTMGAVENYDVGKLISLSSDVYLCSSGDPLSDLLESSVENHLEKLTTDSGRIYNFSYKIKDVEDLSIRKFRNLVKQLEAEYEDFDSDSITKAKVAKVTMTAQRGKKKLTESCNIYIVKENRTWKLLYID